MTGDEQVLVEDWCQQYPSHSIGGLAFGADGALYVTRRRRRELQLRRLRPGRQPAEPLRRSARRRRRHAHAADRRGRRAAQPGSPDDRRSGRRSTARSSASIPTTGAALPDNPLAGSSDANARRIVAYGLRNPFRITVRPGTNELWIGDVGWNNWEEINRVVDPTTRRSRTSAGPATRATARQPGYDDAEPDASARTSTPRPGAVTAPYFTYNHSAKVVAGETLPDRQLVDLRPRVLPGRQHLSRPTTTARSSSPTTRATASG